MEVGKAIDTSMTNFPNFHEIVTAFIIHHLRSTLLNQFYALIVWKINYLHIIINEFKTITFRFSYSF